MALIPPFYSDCVVAIGCDDVRGERHWSASGFLYGYFLSALENGVKQYRVFLISNRHVFAGLSKDCVLRLNPHGDEPALEYPVSLLDVEGAPKWFSHPNPEIDIALLPINILFLQAHATRFNFFRSDEHVADVKTMKELGTTEGDFAYVLGFPMGLVGDQRNTVIVRNASIARIRDTLAKPDQKFLLDTFFFPGNSGGPVVLKPEPIAIEGTQPQLNAYLIGVAAEYIAYKDVAISKQTGNVRVVFEENSGLAPVHAVDSVKETIQVALKALADREEPVPAPLSDLADAFIKDGRLLDNRSDLFKQAVVPGWKMDDFVAYVKKIDDIGNDPGR